MISNMKSVYIICAKCGSDDMLFINQELEPEEKEDCGSGICITCNECGTMTSIEEYNEYKLGAGQLVDRYRTPMTDEEIIEETFRRG